MIGYICTTTLVPIHKDYLTKLKMATLVVVIVVVVVVVIIVIVQCSLISHQQIH